MTRKAIGAVVSISVATPVHGIHGRLVVRVAIQTGKYSVIRGIRMAIGASFPFTPVGSAVNGEMQVVVVENGTLPRRNVVATFAILGESAVDVVGIRRSLVIGQMAGNTFLGQAGIGPTGMTTVAIQLMPTLQGKESMFEALSRAVPLPADHVVATVAIGTETGCPMVWCCRCFVFIPVAAVAVRPHHVVPLPGTRYVASIAIGFRMHAYQWKARLAVYLLHLAVRYQPGFRCVATGTIVTDGLLMHVLVAFVAVGRCLFKVQRRMALLATHQLVLPRQRKLRLAVIEILWFYVVPFFRRMAVAAVQLEILAVRGLHGKTA
jgi:hypothetical protein